MSRVAEVEKVLTRDELLARPSSLETDVRFRDFPGKIEINEYGDLLMAAASRLHVVVQKRLGAYLEERLEVKSDANTLKDPREKRDELLGAGAREVWFVFPEARRVEFYGREGQRERREFGIELGAFRGEL